MRFSLLDDKAKVFFSETLDNKPLIYDGLLYRSVNECFTLRRVSQLMWDPFTVPLLHQIHFPISIGFLVNKGTGECYTFDFDGMDQEKMYNMGKQLEVLVKARLFSEYYEQAFNRHVDNLEKMKIASRYKAAYDACQYLVNNVQLIRKELLLMSYDCSESSVDYCSLVSSVSEIPRGAVIPTCNRLRMSAATFKALSKRGYGWVRLAGDAKLEIVIDSEEEKNDFFWELVRLGGYEPNLCVGGVGYGASFTVFFGSTNDREILRDVNWNRAYVCEVSR